MLRRADNVSVEFRKSLFSSKGRTQVHIGRIAHRAVMRIPEEEFLQVQRDQQRRPHLLFADEYRTYWWFQDKFYWENDGLNESEVYALLVTRHQRAQQHLDRAQAMVAMAGEPRVRARGYIPDDVKQLVWLRDQGRCVACGSTSELQYDHIIPVAMGGGSTIQNLQLLCGPCNRRKAAGLTLG